MLQLGFIRENREYVIERLGVKHFKDAEQIIDNVISQDNKRRNTQTELDRGSQFLFEQERNLDEGIPIAS